MSGLDFHDDGRAIGRVDWDLDGDVDLWIANRSGPQLRFLRNEMQTDHHYVALRLAGRTCNRDAIGARVELTIQSESPMILIHTLRAGDGYLSQSSKWVHFGIGDSTSVQRLVVRWPGGVREEFTGVAADRRFRIVQGTGRAEPWKVRSRTVALQSSHLKVPPRSDQADAVLTAAIPLPRLGYTTFDGRKKEIPASGDRPVLLNLWAAPGTHRRTKG